MGVIDFVKNKEGQWIVKEKKEIIDFVRNKEGKMVPVYREKRRIQEDDRNKM